MGFKALVSGLGLKALSGFRAEDFSLRVLGFRVLGSAAFGLALTLKGSLTGVSEHLAADAGMQGAAEPDRDWMFLRISL